jgi:hypothetical protein
MAGDVFFTADRIWSSNSIGFVDLMQRAGRKCRAGEDSLVRIFADAEELRSLGINLHTDRQMQSVLSERVLEAARDHLQELRANPGSRSQEMKSVQELIELAQAHLRELGCHPTG